MADALGTAYVEIEPRVDSAKFGKEVEEQVDKAVKGPVDKVNKEVGDGMSGAFKKVGTAIAAAGVGAFFKSAIGQASDLNEQTSKVKTVFGDASDAVLAFGEGAAKSIGASKVEALSAVGTFGNLLRSVGLSAEKAGDMSIKMTQLAGDLASFNNVPIGDALAAIQSGLTGETEPLKAFGVNMNEATLKAEAMRLGLDVSGTTLSAVTKSQAAYSLILSQTTLAQGDYQRTADGTANTQRTLGALWKDAQADIGQALLPAMQGLLETGMGLVPTMTDLGTQVGVLLGAAGELLTPLLGIVGAFTGSGAGIFTLEVLAAGIATNKLIGYAQKGLTALQGLAAGMTTATIASAGIGLLAAAAVGIWQAHSKAQADARERADDMTESMKAAGNPVATLTDELESLNKQLHATATEAGTSAAAVSNNLLSETDLMSKLGKENVKVLTDMGYTAKQIADAITGHHLGDLLDEIKGKKEDMMDSMDLVELKEFNDQNIKLNKSLREQGAAWGDANKKAAEGAEAHVRNAVALGDLTPEWLANAEATSTATSETDKWIQIGQAAIPVEEALIESRKKDAEVLASVSSNYPTYDEVMQHAAGTAETLAAKVKDTAIAHDISYTAAARVVEIDEDLKGAEDDLAGAKDAVKDAINKATEAQEAWLFLLSGAAATEDAVTSSVLDLANMERDQAKAVAEGKTSFEDTTRAGIEHRKGLEAIYDKAVDVVNSYDTLGVASGDVAAHQAGLAQQTYETAKAAGVEEEEAAALRDRILEIPKERTTEYDVAITNEQEAKNKLAALEEERRVNLRVVVSGFEGLSDAEIRAVAATGYVAAEGAMVTARKGGSLVWAGEAGQDEAIVPLPPGLLAGLQAIAAEARAGGTGPRGGAGDTVVVNVSAGMPDAAAERTGRIVGETAAEVLAQRRVALALRVGG